MNEYLLERVSTLENDIRTYRDRLMKYVDQVFTMKSERRKSDKETVILSVRHSTTPD